MKPLPPELLPKLYPATRFGAIERCQMLLADMAAPGNTCGFALLIVEHDNTTTQVGQASLRDCHTMAAAALHMLGEAAATKQLQGIQDAVQMALHYLGIARTTVSWGGVRPAADDGDATPHDDNGGAP